jgi:hypothetical protein
MVLDELRILKGFYAWLRIYDLLKLELCMIEIRELIEKNHKPNFLDLKLLYYLQLILGIKMQFMIQHEMQLSQLRRVFLIVMEK